MATKSGQLRNSRSASMAIVSGQVVLYLCRLKIVFCESLCKVLILVGKIMNYSWIAFTIYDSDIKDNLLNIKIELTQNSNLVAVAIQIGW